MVRVCSALDWKCGPCAGRGAWRAAARRPCSLPFPRCPGLRLSVSIAAPPPCFLRGTPGPSPRGAFSFFRGGGEPQRAESRVSLGGSAASRRSRCSARVRGAPCPLPSFLPSFRSIKGPVFVLPKPSLIDDGDGAGEGDPEEGAERRRHLVPLRRVPWGRGLGARRPHPGSGQGPQPVRLARPGEHQRVQVRGALGVSVQGTRLPVRCGHRAVVQVACPARVPCTSRLACRLWPRSRERLSGNCWDEHCPRNGSHLKRKGVSG